MKPSIILYYLFTLYFWILIVRIFLTWIPTIDWKSPMFKTIANVSDIYLEPFRKFIPAMGGIDFSPIVALLILQFCQNAICIGLARMGF